MFSGVFEGKNIMWLICLAFERLYLKGLESYLLRLSKLLDIEKKKAFIEWKNSLLCKTT